MPRNVELRERIGGGFNHADSLLYLKTHINMVEGLLVNSKLALSLIPDELKTGLKYISTIAAAATTTDLYNELTSFKTTFGLDDASLKGCFFVASASFVLTVGAGYVVKGDDGGAEVASGGTLTLEVNDWIIYRGFFTTVHLFDVINNTHGLATASVSGLMSSSDKSKLDGIAASANNYSHPTQTAIDVNATDDGISVVDRVQVNTLGHVTAVSLRNLTNATTTTPGPMSAADKLKLDGIAANANNYSLPTAEANVLGGIKIGSTLSIASGIVDYNLPAAAAGTRGGIKVGTRLSISGDTLSADQQTEQNFTSVLKSKLDGIASNANNYSHPTGGADVALTLATNETINGLTVNADGHVSVASKQTIRTGSTSQTGLLQLATGTELTTSLSTSKVTTPDAVKSMINFFGAAFTRYVDLAAANAASHPDGSFCLVTVA